MTTGITNLKELNKSFKKIMKLLENDTTDVLRYLGFNMLAQLQTHTAIDSGRARNGWIPAVSRTPSNWKPPKGLGSYSVNIFPSNQVKHNSEFHISNSVEYIISLNEGHSSQFQNGILGPAFNNVMAKLEGKISQINRKKYNV